MLRSRAAAAALATALATAPALAGEAGDILRAGLYGGDYRSALEQLAPLAAAGDEEARFAVGFGQFVGAIEALAQALHRHGLAIPGAETMGQPLVLPVPVNPNPAPLDYAGVRDILEDVVAGFDSAAEALLAAGESGDYVVPIDPLKVRIDIDGDGVPEPTESLAGIFEAASAPGQPPRSTAPAEPDGRSRQRGAEPPEAPAAPPPEGAPETVVGFDRADAIWLAGYSNIVAAQADFFLAHDFEDFVNVSFHRFFPHAGLPMEAFAEGGMLVMDPQTDTAIADAIAAVHTLDWPVVEPDRLARVRERLKTVIALSRRNWEAILAETDDERELVPSPRQTPIVPDGHVTDEVVAAWLETLDTAELILEGELLVPHWRFRQGFDLRAYFETAERTDFVMLLTGYDALPFLREGPVATAESFAAANRVFGDRLLGYVFWFN